MEAYLYYSKGERMVTKLLLTVLFFISTSSYAGQKFVVAAYNVENLFDTLDDPGKDDADYTPTGKNQWTDEKLNLKVEQLAKQIRAINNGIGPDVIALPETENIRALNILNSKLKDLKYNAILLEGPDQRGIDVALLSRFPLARKPIMMPISEPGNPIWLKPTRPIYNIVLQVAPNVNFGLLLNHWPSRMGGPELRCAAGNKLKKNFQMYLKNDPNIDVIALGDFNDEPEDISLQTCLPTGTVEQVIASTPDSPLFFNLHREKPLLPDQRGTYWYGQKKVWNALDHIILTRGLFDNKNVRYVSGTFSKVLTKGLNVSDQPLKLPNGKLIPPGAPIPFTLEGQPGSYKYYGVSDHLPVRAMFEIVQ